MKSIGTTALILSTLILLTSVASAGHRQRMSEKKAYDTIRASLHLHLYDVAADTPSSDSNSYERSEAPPLVPMSPATQYRGGSDSCRLPGPATSSGTSSSDFDTFNEIFQQ